MQVLAQSCHQYLCCLWSGYISNSAKLTLTMRSHKTLFSIIAEILNLHFWALHGTHLMRRRCKGPLAWAKMYSQTFWTCKMWLNIWATTMRVLQSLQNKSWAALAISPRGYAIRLGLMHCLPQCSMWYPCCPNPYKWGGMLKLYYSGLAFLRSRLANRSGLMFICTVTCCILLRHSMCLWLCTSCADHCSTRQAAHAVAVAMRTVDWLVLPQMAYE